MQGYGRLNQAEIDDVTKKDLMALSTSVWIGGIRERKYKRLLI
jgi:hypothetical protein